MHVLIVDDDQAFAETVRSVVVDALNGVTVVSIAHTGEGGMEAIGNSDTIDVAILDMKLPGPSGVKVAQRVREKNRYALIILLTGSEDDEAIRVARQWSDRVLRKAEFMDELTRALVAHQR